VSGGTATSPCATAQQSALSSRPERRDASRGLVGLGGLDIVEAHGRRLADGGLVLHLERRLHVIAEHHRGEIRGELAHRDVVILHGVDVAIAGDGDAVFGAFELRLEIAEVRIGLEVRIALDDDHEARQRAAELALRLLELLKRLRVVDQLWRGLDRADLGSRFGHLPENLALLAREAFHGAHQIRNEIRAALILIEHLRPCGLDLLVLCLKGVITAARQAGGADEDKGSEEFLHGPNLRSRRCTSGLC
jgi:hypothetical protein